MLNLLMHLNKLIKRVHILIRKLDMITHVLKFETFSGIFTLVLHYHVVHDQTTCHHFPQGSWVPLFSRSTKNCKMGLEHSKCPLHIISSSFSSLGTVRSFLPNWLSDGLGEGSPRILNTINQLVAHVVLMAKHSIVARTSLPFSQPSKQWRLLQHIDVIVRPGHAKESVPNPNIM